MLDGSRRTNAQVNSWSLHPKTHEYDSRRSIPKIINHDLW
jgi:hypothetical protein